MNIEHRTFYPPQLCCRRANIEHRMEDKKKSPFRLFSLLTQKDLLLNYIAVATGMELSDLCALFSSVPPCLRGEIELINL